MEMFPCITDVNIALMMSDKNIQSTEKATNEAITYFMNVFTINYSMLLGFTLFAFYFMKHSFI